MPGVQLPSDAYWGGTMRHRNLLIVLAISAVLAGIAPARAAEYTKLTDVRVAMDDGVRLAADVYVPTVADQDGDGLYPCVVELTPYRKESRYAEGALYLPGAGIALIEVDARGTGGSEGEYDVVFSVREQADAARMVDWAATGATKDGTATGPKLCETTVGMYGGSYSGIIQYLAASLPDNGFPSLPAATPSPYLAAIAPQRAYGDLYRDIVYHGGQVIGSFGLIWSSGTTAYYTEPPTDAGTSDGLTAWSDHLSKNDPMMVPYLQSPYSDAEFESDDASPKYAQKLYEDSSVLPRIANLRVPSLHLAGFYDSFPRGQLLTFQRAHELEKAAAPGTRGPNFLIAGPWNHTGTHFINPEQGFKEKLGEWYRYWLEGKAAGLVAPAWITAGLDGNGARVQYFQSSSGIVNGDAPSDGAWAFSPSWPPAAVSVQRLYLREDGGLSPVAPGPEESADAYLYNPAAGTAELLSRWDNAAGTPQPQWDQRTDEPKGVSYTTDVLGSAVKVAGPISLRLFASTAGVGAGEPVPLPGAGQAVPPYHDTDWIVKVSDVAPDGSSLLVTQGYLRASHRAVDFSKSEVVAGEVLGPYHPHTFASLQPPIPGAVHEYLIEVHPTAKTLLPGHRLRISIYSADTPNHINIAKPALNQIFHNTNRASYLAIPVVS